MANDWDWIKLGDAGQWLSGGTPPKSDFDYWQKEIPWVSPKDMGVRYVETAEDWVSKHSVPRHTRLVPENTILIVVRSMRLANEVQIAFTKRPVTFNQDLKAVICNQKVIPRFLFFYLHSQHQTLLELVDEATHGTRRLKSEALYNLLVPIPSIKEQKKILKLLEALDDKIELNRQMNETLEAMAQALFKSWFVDFDPVKANAEGRPLPGIAPSLQALFPTSFEPSTLGDIPSGWQESVLGNVCSYLKRGIQPSYIEGEGILVINQKCIRDRWLDFNKARRHDPTKRSIIGRELFIGDVLINSTGIGTLGRVAQVLYINESIIADSHVTVVRADTKIISSHVLGLGLLSRENEIESMGEGSTGQIELGRERIANLTLIIPSHNIQSAFDKYVDPIRHKMVSNTQESQILAQLRDTLLPKLLSGELRLTEAEAKVEALV